MLALQRHEFTSPDVRWIAIGLAIGPWVIAAFPATQRLLGATRGLDLVMHVAWCVSVLVGVFWLIFSYHGNDDCSPFVVALLIGEVSASRGWRFGAAVWAVSLAALFTYIAIDHPYGMWIWAFAFTVGWMGGVAYGRQVRIAYLLAEAQSRLAEQAAEEERHRLARDVHDLVAHSLAVTMLQLSGARLALAAGETDEALEALGDAESAGRAAMTEIHRTVGLLGSADERGTRSATPSAADLPALVASFEKAGLRVDFELDGPLETVPMATGLAAYRVVQESLSNAVKHAPGEPVRLRIGVGQGEIVINVVNPIGAGVRAAVSPTGGNGLRGMAERAELLGGRASAGNGNGTWKVDATIPWPVPTA